MTLLAKQSSAAVAATRNFNANRDALANTQPRLALHAAEHQGEWIFGRDGYLTARDENQKWLTGCSLPRRAAEEILRKLNVGGLVACFLAPSHAAQIRVALDRLEAEQAIVCIVPDERTLAMILSCDDFREEIAAHRLWFVAGNPWQSELRELLKAREGLALPSQFIRLPTIAQDVIDAIIPPAQNIFSDLTAVRTTKIRSLREQWRAASSDRLCVVAPSRFRLWNDLGDAIKRALDSCGVEWTQIDLDDPANSSPLTIASAAQNCGAILTIDTARADSPVLLPEDLPWIAWITMPRIPSFTGAGKRDQLLIADQTLREDASGGGWSIDRVHVCGLPASRAPDTRPAQALAIIENTHPTDAPKDLREFSSHVVLWETIADELLRNPFCLGPDAQKYLAHHAARLQIAPENLNRGRFIKDLVFPAYAQGIARALIRAKLPIKLFGRGWDRIAEFAPHAACPIATRAEFESALDLPIAAVHVWPWLGAHAIDSLGKSVLRRTNNSIEDFVSSARQIINNLPALPPRSIQPFFSLDAIKNALDRARSDS